MGAQSPGVPSAWWAQHGQPCVLATSAVAGPRALPAHTPAPPQSTRGGGGCVLQCRDWGPRLGEKLVQGRTARQCPPGPQSGQWPSQNSPFVQTLSQGQVLDMGDNVPFSTPPCAHRGTPSHVTLPTGTHSDKSREQVLASARPPSGTGSQGRRPRMGLWTRHPGPS